MHAWLTLPSLGKSDKLFVKVFNTVVGQVLFVFVGYNVSSTR